MRFIDLFHKGYALLDITRERLQGEFWHLATITEKAPGRALAAAYFTTRGNNHLEAARGASAPERSGNPLPRQGWAAGSKLLESKIWGCRHRGGKNMTLRRRDVLKGAPLAPLATGLGGGLAKGPWARKAAHGA